MTALAVAMLNIATGFGPFVSFLLDFSLTASVCVDMEHERIRDDISGAFADLTALLEDAAGMAVEGQSLRCTIKDLENIAAFIWPGVNRISKVLAALEQLITICPRD